MKHKFVLSLLASVVCAIPISTLSAQTNEAAVVFADKCPTQTGFYFSDHGQWKPMEQVRSMGVKTTGVAKAAFSYGMASMKVKATFPDRIAPVQLNDAVPTFCSVNVAEQGRDVVVAKLDSHGKNREIQLASARAWTGVSVQYRDKDVVKFQVEKQGEQTFLIRAPADLHAGEYIIFPRPQGPGKDANFQKVDGPTAIGGYDFGYGEHK